MLDSWEGGYSLQVTLISQPSTGPPPPALLVEMNFAPKHAAAFLEASATSSSTATVAMNGDNSNPNAATSAANAVSSGKVAVRLQELRGAGVVLESRKRGVISLLAQCRPSTDPGASSGGSDCQTDDATGAAEFQFQLDVLASHERRPSLDCTERWPPPPPPTPPWPPRSPPTPLPTPPAPPFPPQPPTPSPPPPPVFRCSPTDGLISTGVSAWLIAREAPNEFTRGAARQASTADTSADDSSYDGSNDGTARAGHSASPLLSVPAPLLQLSVAPNEPEAGLYTASVRLLPGTAWPPQAGTADGDGVLSIWLRRSDEVDGGKGVGRNAPSTKSSGDADPVLSSSSAVSVRNTGSPPADTVDKQQGLRTELGKGWGKGEAKSEGKGTGKGRSLQSMPPSSLLTSSGVLAVRGGRLRAPMSSAPTDAPTSSLSSTESGGQRVELVAFDLRRALRLSELAAEDVQEGLLLQFVGVGSAPAVYSMQCDEHSAERTGGGVGVGEDSSTEVTTRTSELCCAGKRHGANTAETAGRIEWSKAEAAPWCIDVH